MNYRKACLVFGNGDFQRGQRAIFMLAQRLVEARGKHKLFAHGPSDAAMVIGAEHRELVHATLFESPGRQIDEALDVACTAMRFVNGEHMRRQITNRQQPWDKWGDDEGSSPGGEEQYGANGQTSYRLEGN